MYIVESFGEPPDTTPTGFTFNLCFSFMAAEFWFPWTSCDSGYSYNNPGPRVASHGL